MKYSIFIRPLILSDAHTSYKWRNNKLIWKFTKFKPDKKITKDVEIKWLENALTNKNDYRFAICLKETGQYIGNVQLTNVRSKKAEFHIFIGDTTFWGKGLGREAAELILDYGYNILLLDEITLEFRKGNVAAEKMYKNLGFQIIDDSGPWVEMVLKKHKYKDSLNEKWHYQSAQ